MQISVVNGSVEFDGEPVLSEINFELHDKEKIALVGRNGCGKTTFLRALTGEIPFVKGTGEEDLGVYFLGKPTLGYLKQVVFSNEKQSMYEEVKTAFADIMALEKDLQSALEKLEKTGSEDAVRSYSLLHEKFENTGGYTYEKECVVAIRKFGFSEEEMSRPVNEFSGGQRTKIALLKLLLSRPEVLLLDEPTNHLDIEAVEWLENYLKNYKNSIVIVSHDRMFLDRVVNVVYEIEYGEAIRYRGNYTDFCRQKKEKYEKDLKDATARFKEIERLQKLVDRFRYKASKAAMAQAKLSQIKRIGEIDMPTSSDDKTFHATFQPLEETVRKTLVVDHLSFGYDRSLGEVSFLLEKGQKLGIVGANGCGKSTFVRTLMGKIPVLGGVYLFGLHSKIGYFDQTATQSESTSTVFDSFHSRFPMMTDTEVRTALGSFLLTGEDVFKRVCDLSGGEKVRLALCMILRERPNILILDEPTNHMDIVGKETFEQMLVSYQGTLIIVSHDRYLINKVCDRILGFEENSITCFEGKYEEYEKFLLSKRETQQVKKVAQTKERKDNISEQKEKQKKEKRILYLENKISENEEKIASLNEQLSTPEVYSDYKKIEEIQSKVDLISNENNALWKEWEELNS